MGCDRPRIGDDKSVSGFFERQATRVEGALVAARRRWRLVDHIWRAAVLYSDEDASRLVAAAAYRGFFAVFAMVVVLFVVLARLFRNNTTIVDIVQSYLVTNLPQLHAREIFQGSQQIGLVALIGLVIAGVGWVEALRSSQRAMWKLDPHPGNPVIRWLVDLAVLVGLGILLLTSIAVFSGVQELLFWLAGDFTITPVRLALRGTTTLTSGVVDLILGAALLAGVPRLRLPLHRLVPSALMFAVGLGLLKTAGRWYITRTESNPAYQLVAGTVGLLLFMYVLHQILMFAAAVAATDEHGKVVDLAGGEVPPDLRALAESAARAAAMVDEAAVTAERAAKAAERAVSTTGGDGPDG
jgi:membrane protein